jgi:hypothetical protein
VGDLTASHDSRSAIVLGSDPAFSQTVVLVRAWSVLAGERMIVVRHLPVAPVRRRPLIHSALGVGVLGALLLARERSLVAIGLLAATSAAFCLGRSSLGGFIFCRVRVLASGAHDVRAAEQGQRC